jgi:hypothetical protein
MPKIHITPEVVFLFITFIQSNFTCSSYKKKNILFNYIYINTEH